MSERHGNSHRKPNATAPAVDSTGREDTGDLEAQIRGSRYAWHMRVVSTEALLRMLRLKEEVEDPSTVQRIYQILIPREFTRLDPTIEIALSAVADVKQESEADIDEEEQASGKKFTHQSRFTRRASRE